MSELDKKELDRIIKTANRVFIFLGVVIFCCFLVFCAKHLIS